MEKITMTLFSKILKEKMIGEKVRRMKMKI